MATFLSDLAEKAAARLPSDGLRNGDDANGKLTLATATVIIPSTLVATDIIEIIPERLLPPAAVIVPQLSSVTCPDPGTALTIHIGYKGSVKALADTIDLKAGGQINFCDGTLPANAVEPVRNDTIEGGIFATVATATAIANETPITFTIAYRSK